eukprot:TRINITY_DN970_c2_g1_i2.p1 TRINITY_DN970_c2_g1~~TRINITY_DN970_c2_g1_i2.p1  ORF type:complete len:1582 (+),score=502.16 TRINITY_DN970_c2_g1_i2:364-4746(+)
MQSEGDFEISSVHSTEKILLGRASNAAGTWFSLTYPPDEDDIDSVERIFISYAAQFELMNGDILLILTGFPDIDEDFIYECTAEFNKPCSVENANSLLGRAQSSMLPLLDEPVDGENSVMNLWEEMTDNKGRRWRTPGGNYAYVIDEDETYWAAVSEAHFGRQFVDIVTDAGMETQIADDSFAAIRDASIIGNSWAEYTWKSHYVGGNNAPKRSLVLRKMAHDDKYNYLGCGFYDLQAPLASISESETRFISLKIMDNIYSQSGAMRAELFNLKVEPDVYVNTWLENSKTSGVTPFLMDMKTGDVMTAPDIDGLLNNGERRLDARSLTAVKSNVNDLMAADVLNAIRWNRFTQQILDDKQGWFNLDWVNGKKYIGWFAIVWTAKRTYLLGNVVFDDVSPRYSETCSIREESGCNAETIEVIVSRAKFKMIVDQQQALYTVSADPIMSTDGGHGLMVIDAKTDMVVANTISTDASGFTLDMMIELWQIKNITSTELLTKFESAIERSYSNEKGFFLFPWKLDYDSEEAIFRGFVTSHRVVGDKYYLLSYYQVKDSDNTIAEQQGTDLPFCTAAFESDCVSEHANHLLTETLSELRYQNFIMPDFNLTQYLDVWTHNPRNTIDYVSFHDFEVEVLNKDGVIIGCLSDKDHVHSECQNSRIGETWETLFEKEGMELLDIEGHNDKLGDVDANELFELINEKSHISGILESRWFSYDVRVNGEIIKYNIFPKHFMMDDEIYYILTQYIVKPAPPKCGNCGINQECGTDKTFCDCEDGFVNIGSTHLTCEPVFVITKPEQNMTYIAYGCVIFGVLSVSWCIWLFKKHKSTKLMRMSSYKACQVVNVGLLMMFFSALPFIIQPADNDYVCIARPIMLLVSCNIVLTVLFAKTWRISKLINNKKMKKLFITDRYLFQISARIVSPVLVCLLVWVVVFTPKYVYKKFEVVNATGNEAMDVCSEEFPMIVLFSIVMSFQLLFGSIQAWKSRDAPLASNESSEILLSLFVFLFFGIIIVPMQWLVVDDPTTMVLLRGIGCCFVSITMLFSIFGKKMIWLAMGYGNREDLLTSSNDSRGRMGYRHSSRSQNSRSTAAGATVANRRANNVSVAFDIMVHKGDERIRSGASVVKRNATNTANTDDGSIHGSIHSHRMKVIKTSNPNGKILSSKNLKSTLSKKVAPAAPEPVKNISIPKSGLIMEKKTVAGAGYNTTQLSEFALTMEAGNLHSVDSAFFDARTASSQSTGTVLSKFKNPTDSDNNPLSVENMNKKKSEENDAKDEDKDKKKKKDILKQTSSNNLIGPSKKSALRPSFSKKSLKQIPERTNESYDSSDDITDPKISRSTLTIIEEKHSNSGTPNLSDNDDDNNNSGSDIISVDKEDDNDDNNNEMPNEMTNPAKDEIIGRILQMQESGDIPEPEFNESEMSEMPEKSDSPIALSGDMTDQENSLYASMINSFDPDSNEGFGDSQN